MGIDTIFALASGRPPAAIGLIRISGPRAHDAGRALAGELPEPRQAALRELRHPSTGERIDQGLVLRFDGPASATGEDVIELHCHGGRAVVEATLAALGVLDDLRLAEPGEFTRRAFESGRIDLTEAEGLADLIEAETESQRRAALAVAEGGLRRQIEDWQAWLLALSARAEAAIDYAEEDETASDPALLRECGALAAELSEWLSRPRIEPLRDGLKVVVAGPTNAGKSSLVNAIAGFDKAIVTAVHGTTRDQIEVPLALGGVPILLTDTAGLRATDDAVERIGIGRAQRLIDTADILLWLGEPDEAPPHPRLIRVHARCDLADRGGAPAGSLPVSSVTGEGLGRLLTNVERLAHELVPASDALALNRRQAACLSEVRESLQAVESAGDFVIVAEHLRAARMAFDRLTGRAGVEEVLDALFGRFCLGK